MRNRTCKGFSLLELMVVIVILGMTVAMSVPAFGRFMQNWRLNAETDEFAMMMRSARSAAIMKNVTAVFEFDIQAGTYQYFEDDDGDGNHDGDEYLSSTAEVPQGLAFQAHTLNDTRLVFGPRGNCDESGSITLRNAHQKQRTVTIFGGTGNIRID